MSDDIFNIVLEQTDRLFAQGVDKNVLGNAERGEWPAALWSKAAELGLPAAMAPEGSGGVGLSWGETATLIRRMGYHAAPLPLPETILANALWCGAGGELMEGPCTLGPVSPGDRIRLQQDDGVFSLHGKLRFVPWHSQATTVLVHAVDENGRDCLCRLPKSAGAPTRRNLAGEPRENAHLGGIRIAAGDVRPLPQGFGAMGFLPSIAALRTQQMIGAMERCFDHALVYANERVQFGRPIAKFQAIQHMLAIAAGQLAAATAAADASSALHAPDEDLFIVAAAKARVGEAVGPLAAIAHQVHGAMGFTHEHPLHFSTRRLWSWRDEGGSESYWQEWIGRLICARGGEAFWPLIVDAQPPSDRAESKRFMRTS